MKNPYRIIGTLSAIALGLTLALGSNPASASWGKRDAAVDPQYASECGECHVAYPAGALPARSWNKIMDGLADHFGDSAESDTTTEAALRTYLTANASNTGGGYGEVGKLTKRLKSSETPLRITELRYFKKEHDEIPRRVYTLNPDLSLSQCDACHTRATQNSYEEREIDIPNFGPWDD